MATDLMYAVTEGEAWLVPTRTQTNAVDQRSKIIDKRLEK